MSAIPEQAFTELRALYAKLAAELEPFRRHCDARGLCCNFAKTGHMLFLTNLEAAEMARCGEKPDRTLSAAGTCPYLRGKLCGAREHRALGCRLYFCDPTYEEQRNEIYERFLKLVRATEARFGVAHAYQPVTKIDFDCMAS
jgi:hypothetical protein